MNTYKRIEIKAFRRRILLVTGEAVTGAGVIDIRFDDSHSNETVETESQERQEILIEAIRLLEQRIGKPLGPPIEQADARAAT